MPEGTDDILLLIIVFVAVIVAVFWLALVIWAYRDMRARSRDPVAQLLGAILVAVLNIPGFFIYIMLRPRETLSEAYDRSLEEEALLQEIEENRFARNAVSVHRMIGRRARIVTRGSKKLALTVSICLSCLGTYVPAAQLAR